MRGLIGKKIGMTQVFDAQGQHTPVTVLEVGPCVVLQRKTAARDGYDAAQLGFGEQKEQRLTKPQKGHFARSGAPAKKVVREIRLAEGEDIQAGQTVTAQIFEGVSHVDVTGTTKGQGYQGVVKRHRMGGGPAAHGHTSHRRIGAIGQRTWPARIMKNKRMPGHMGHLRVTTQNLAVVAVRPEDNVILVRGAVPGANGSTVIVCKALKKVK